MAGTLEAGVAADVHVQQAAGARPLIAVGRFSRRALGPGDAGPLEHLPDRRVGEAGDGSDRPGPQPVSRRQAQISFCRSGAVRRRGRDAEGRRGGLDARSFFDRLHERQVHNEWA